MYIVTEKDLIGDIEGFPIEVVQKMIERQYEKHGKCDISVFQDFASAYAGFTWKQSIEEHDFWEEVIARKKFALFFDRYPKQEDLPLPRMVLAWNKDETRAEKRELLHVFPESLGLDYRYIIRSSCNTGNVISCRNIKEIPTTKKMTKSEIEKELGYKIELINNK